MDNKTNNWKMRCAGIRPNMDDLYTVGKIYEVKNGIIKRDNGSKSIGFDSFNMFIQFSSAKWELVEEPEAQLSYEQLDKFKEDLKKYLVKKETDTINPDHYKNQCSLECIEAMEMAFGREAVYHFCICNAWEYAWRHKNKNGMRDLEKAQWYLDKADELAGSNFESGIIGQMVNVLKNLKDKINN